MHIRYCVICQYMCVMLCLCCHFFFFFKQKTAYEMRISDWSSDVCSSDLGRMKPSSYYDRIVDVVEELVRFIVLLRPHVDQLVDRYSERVEADRPDRKSVV